MIVSKAIRNTSIIILFFVILFITLTILCNFYFNKKIIEITKEEFYKSSDREYILSIDDLHINLFNQSITLTNLAITPSDPIAILKSKYVFKSKAIRLLDVSIMAYLKRKDFILDRIEIDNPQVSIFQSSERLQKKKVVVPENNLSKHTSLSKKLNSISIGHIDILNSKINFYKNGTNESAFSSTENNLSVENLYLNFKTTDKAKFFLVDKFEVVMNNFYYKLADSLYTVYGKSLRASYNDSNLIIDSLKVIPNYNIKEFAKVARFQTSRTEVITSKVNLIKIDYNLLFNETKLNIHKVELAGCKINVFRDNQYPLAQILRPSLQTMVKDLPFYIVVDSIEMKNGTLSFEGITPNSEAIGKIEVNNMNIIIEGIKNDTTMYTDNQSINAMVSGTILNQAKFSQTITFPLKTTKDFFYSSGRMTSMSLTSFNPIILPSKHISIMSGQLDSVSFSFVARENLSDGEMKFMYHDLNVEMIAENGQKNGLKQKFKTLLMNKYIVENSNPGKSGDLRISKIQTKNNPYRFFINYSMQSILSGIEPSIVGEKNAKRNNKK